jgi:SAM-dependent methyltransferase
VEVEEYARIAAVEDDHWWYRNTRALVDDLLTARLAGRDDLVLLDAGCGPGGNGAWLARHGTVIGVDRSPEALAFVHERRPDTQPVRGDITALPLATATVDVAVAITVLYAVDDDVAALAELARVVRPGGTIVLVEPAFPSLRREHDATVHGVRRYRRPALRSIAASAGLTVERCTYAYSFLAPAAAGLALVDRVSARSKAPDEAEHDTSSASDVERRTMDRVFAPLADAERRVLAKTDLPLGTSVILVATR